MRVRRARRQRRSETETVRSQTEAQPALTKSPLALTNHCRPGRLDQERLEVRLEVRPGESGE